MQKKKEDLPFWKGFCVADLQVQPVNDRGVLPLGDLHDLCCGRWGQRATGLHQQVYGRNLGMWGRPGWLQVELRITHDGSGAAMPPFFESLGAAACARILAEAMDMINWIKRRAFGYGDADAFILKIEPAFPGNP